MQPSFSIPKVYSKNHLLRIPEVFSTQVTRCLRHLRAKAHESYLMAYPISFQLGRRFLDGISSHCGKKCIPQCIYLSNHTTKEAFLEQNPMLTADSKLRIQLGKVILEATHNKVNFPHFRQQKEMGEKYNRGFRFSILFEKRLL